MMIGAQTCTERKYSDNRPWILVRQWTVASSKAWESSDDQDCRTSAADYAYATCVLQSYTSWRSREWCLASTARTLQYHIAMCVRVCACVCELSSFGFSCFFSQTTRSIFSLLDRNFDGEVSLQGWEVSGNCSSRKREAREPQRERSPHGELNVRVNAFIIEVESRMSTFRTWGGF
eukprot:4810284-Amphidinium_carterae.1